MLSRFFDKSTIFAVDIISIYVYNANLINNVKAFICDSSNKDKLSTIFNNIQFDLIIDDGSHIASHQQNAFECLFPMLKNNGIFICEDVHPSGSINNNLMINYFNNHYLKSQYKSIEIYHRKEKALKCYNCKKINTENLEKCICGISLLPSDNDSISIIIVKK
jgi:23S rRNA U2552 (ribose-2'-O)-methylase RlmE/FtsJ